MKTTLGKLRNITSGILHTEIGDVYKFFEEYLGMEGIMTHNLPGAMNALQPILKEILEPQWFTKEWVKTGLDTPVEIPELTEPQRKVFWGAFKKLDAALWDKIKDKTIVVHRG